MNHRNNIIPSLILLAGLAASAWLYQGTPASEGHGHGAKSSEPEAAKGPNRGRLLSDGDFVLELAIFEAGVPPEFRAWFTKAGKPVSPTDVKLSVTLIRPGQVEDRFNFSPEGGLARGDHEVAEPHSFDYVIVAEHAGVAHRWAFEAPEMQTVIAAAAAEKAGVKVDQAASAELAEAIEVYGRVVLDPDRVRRASARFAGVVLDARKSLGDKVVAGEVIARVENSQTLVSVDVKAPGDGVVITRSAAAG
jgi:cobalt-zinc-cadmium efflux system membrane fusion protein